jgi:hypothetical protein
MYKDYINGLKCVRFQVMATTSLKTTTVWDVTPSSVEVDRRFGGAYCIIRAIFGLMYGFINLVSMYCLKANYVTCLYHAKCPRKVR